MAIDSASIRTYLLDLQKKIATAISALDGKIFYEDSWQRSKHDKLRGDGCSMVLEGGDVIERGGINFSHVHGDKLPPSATMHRSDLAGHGFEAMGVSLVLHPRNPHVPTVHMNVRFFIAKNSQNEAAWWFGGGMDLTPYYGVVADCQHFHRTCQAALTPFGESLYPRFKKECDEYFYLKHRQEARGIGGIFYDDFSELGFEKSFSLTRAVGDAFLDAYRPIVIARKDTPYTDQHRAFQALRRGRYVEFNLVFDRGTLFGLQSGGRTESILMSMPPLAQWSYAWKPEPGSEEDKLYTDFLPPRTWV